MKTQIKIAGLLPAVILPSATFLQLIKILEGNADGVSATAWFLFGLANIGAYLFTEKYCTPQALLAFALPAILDFIIVGVVIFKY